MGHSLLEMPAQAAASCDLSLYVTGCMTTIQSCVVTREACPCSMGEMPAAWGGAVGLGAGWLPGTWGAIVNDEKSP